MIIVFLIFFGLVGLVLLDIWLTVLVQEKLNEQDFLAAFKISQYCKSQNIRDMAENRLVTDYVILKSNYQTNSLSKIDLLKFVQYMGILDEEPTSFWPIIMLARKQKDKELIKVLSENIQSEAWRKVLEADLKKLESAEQ